MGCVGRSQISRRRRELILLDRPGYTASPEAAILGNLWYNREGESEKHLRAVAAILQVSGDEINLQYVHHWAEQLGLTEPWQTVLDRLERDLSRGFERPHHFSSRPSRTRRADSCQANVPHSLWTGAALPSVAGSLST